MTTPTAPALPTSQQVVSAATAAMFGKPLVTNVFRSMLVEAMIAEALQPSWVWCAADYASWDFQHATGVRLEVKQSAARQSWTTAAAGPSVGRFDIAHRTGGYVDDLWVEGRRRFADIYVFAHHPIAGPEADHRDPSQWLFYVVAEPDLPQTRSIGLSGIRERSSPVNLSALVTAIESRMAALPSQQRSPP